MRSVLITCLMLLFSLLAQAQMSDRTMLGASDGSAQDHDLAVALAKLPVRQNPHGKGHAMRAIAAKLDDGLTPDECDRGMEAMYRNREKIRRIKDPSLVPGPSPVSFIPFARNFAPPPEKEDGLDPYLLPSYIDGDNRWLAEGWRNCEYYFGPVYQYQPLARLGEQPKRSLLTVEPQMTEAACDDLEDRIAEVAANVAQYTGAGAHADDMNAPQILDEYNKKVFDLETLRRYCPEDAAKVPTDLVKAANGSTIRVQREFIANPLVLNPPKPKEEVPVLPLPSGFEAGCNIGMDGGECSFTNTTKDPMSACVTVRVHSKASNYDIVSTPVCSGSVSPRSTTKTFALTFPGKVSLQQLCTGETRDPNGFVYVEWIKDDCSAVVSALP